MSLLGIDIGSTGTKGIAFDPEGNQLATAYREYAEVYPGPNRIELPPEDVWNAVREVVAEVESEEEAILPPAGRQAPSYLPGQQFPSPGRPLPSPVSLRPPAPVRGGSFPL